MTRAKSKTQSKYTIVDTKLDAEERAEVLWVPAKSSHTVAQGHYKKTKVSRCRYQDAKAL